MLLLLFNVLLPRRHAFFFSSLELCPQFLVQPSLTGGAELGLGKDHSSADRVEPLAGLVATDPRLNHHCTSTLGQEVLPELIRPDGPLDLHGRIAHLIQSLPFDLLLQRFAHKHFGGAELELVTLGVSVQHNATDVRAWRIWASSQIASLSSRQQAAIAFDEMVEFHANWIAVFTDSDRLQHSSVAQLLQDHGQIEAHGKLFPVGLQAADKPGVASRTKRKSCR